MLIDLKVGKLNHQDIAFEFASWVSVEFKLYLIKDSVWAKFAYTGSDGKEYQVNHYNLDVIISVGYRVKYKKFI